ncbi:hypothetical protein L7F22_051528 [Adiantum nelumboides]|nr:hypothetical protein [Adiantum nelumboides]
MSPASRVASAWRDRTDQGQWRWPVKCDLEPAVQQQVDGHAETSPPAYEYLCHCGEAKEWMEHNVGEELGAVVDMENEMRDGIFLAKLARKFEPECVPRIFTHPKLQYRHTDNTNYFFRCLERVGLPPSFNFELTDLYEKKNFPKVVYCIHALSHILARQGRAIKVGNLVGKLEFSDDQLQKTQRGLDAAGVAMPSFGAVGKTLAKEMNVEPEPEPETEQEQPVPRKAAGRAVPQPDCRKNVPVATIKNFGHLLNDSDHDFEDEIEVERLRKLVVKSIRENQTLDNDVSELDTKISLLVKNKIGIEELIKAKNERGLLRHAEATAAATLARRNSLLSAASDPFADVSLDRQTKRKLELYQELFYTLQTRPEYLARLFARVGRMEMSDKQKKQVEKIVLTLYGYAQKAREEYLLLKLFQRCVAEELSLITSVQEFMRGNAQFIKLVLQYNRGAKERKYLRDLLAPLVHGIMEDDGLDLETDPCAIYRATINHEEMETGQRSQRPMEVSFHEALADPMARTIFIRHLQSLRGTTDAFLLHITGSTAKMPYGIRYIAREVFRALQEKFPSEPESSLLKVVGHLVYYRYLNPAIVAPEGFDVIEKLVGPLQRKNLAEVSKMLTQIAAGPNVQRRQPVPATAQRLCQTGQRPFSRSGCSTSLRCPTPSCNFLQDEFLDHTVQQRPVIYISPNEIYSMHLLVADQIDAMAPLAEGPTSDSLDRARAATGVADAGAQHGPRQRDHVQSGKTLVDVFVAPVTEQDEMAWEEIVSLEVAADRQRQRGQRPPAPPGMPRLEDVRRMSFGELKARTLENMLQLEQLGKVSRHNQYQEMLNAIAIDIRNKHRKRIQRHNEKVAMHTTLANLKEKKSYLKSRSTATTATLTPRCRRCKRRAKRSLCCPSVSSTFTCATSRPVARCPNLARTNTRLPGSLRRACSSPSTSSMRSSTTKSRLRSAPMSPASLRLTPASLGVSAGTCDLRIEDLLEAQFSGQSSLSLMDRQCVVNLNLLIHLINKSESIVFESAFSCLLIADSRRSEFYA